MSDCPRTSNLGVSIQTCQGREQSRERATRKKVRHRKKET